MCHKQYKFRGFDYLSTFTFRTTIRHFNSMEKFNLYAQLYETENRFRRACEQIILLNSRLEELQLRYDQARLDNHKSFRYNLRLKMATVEGVRNSYYEYACWKAETVAELRLQVAVDSTESESNDEEME